MASSSSSSPTRNDVVSLPNNAAVSPPRSPNLSALLSDSCKIDDWKIEPHVEDDAYSFLVAFRARVGEKYKLRPRSVLEDKFGAVARYKGKGRLTGFQKSQWVDVEVFIIGEEYRKDGFALGVLYSASKYHVLKLFKQLILPSFKESH